jgi:hypothetical protein
LALEVNDMKSFSFAVLLALLITVFPGALPGQVVINEVRVDQSSTDTDEYFELAGPAGQSLTGLSYVVIGDSSAGSGSVEAVVTLFGQTIPGSGLFVAAESTFTIGLADFTTDLNFENSDNVTHMLVSGFTGVVGDDLDTDDDGILDSTPWSSIEDDFALLENPIDPVTGNTSAGELVYSQNTIGPDGTFMPAHVVRCPDISGDWEIMPFADLGAPYDTPGSLNTCPEVCDNGADDDGDGDTDCADLDCAGDPSCAPTPPNDDCTAATALIEGVFGFTTLGSSTDGPTNCGGSLLNDIWFIYTASCSGTITFSTCNTTNFNPQMAIYPGSSPCPPAVDSFLACDAGSCSGSGEPEIFLDAIAGEDYLIQIGGFNGERGDGTLTISCPPADCHQFPNPNIEYGGFVGTLVSNAPAAPITDTAPAFDLIDVTSGGTIADLDVGVEITHAFIGNLDIDVVAPSQTQIRLYQSETNSDDDMSLIFDDEGVDYGSVTTWSGSRMQPYELSQGTGSLANFDGEPANGTWGIIIADTFAGSAGGTLDQWSLQISQPLAIPDGTSFTENQILIDPLDTTGILDLDIDIDVTHADASDLEVDLVSPQGTSIRLHDHGAGTDLLGRFDDATGSNDGFGGLIPSGPGTLADFDGEAVGGAWTLTVADTISGIEGSLNGWALQVCPADCSPPTDLLLTSNCGDGTVSLSWINNSPYDSIQIDRDGAPLDTVAGTASDYTDITASDGFHDYTVRGICPVGAASVEESITHYSYNGEDTIVVALEGLFDGGDTGVNDSGQAILDSLLAAGANARMIRTQLDEYACFDPQTVSQVWIACGTYPTDFNLTSEEANLIADLAAAGVAIYFESADHWSFNHPISSFDDRDGVAEPYAQDENDQLTSIDGVDSGLGIDMSGSQNVSYNQDSSGNDYNNYLIPASAELAGGNAGLVWQYDDAIGNIDPNLGVTTAYLPATGAPVICSSFELGGMGSAADRDAAVAAYRAFFGGGPPPPTGGFQRADCNADGAFNIADAVFTLANLFSGGPESTCVDACDSNDDGSVNIADAVFALATLFSGGPNPPAPFGDCDADPTSDPLECVEYNNCP